MEEFNVERQLQDLMGGTHETTNQSLTDNAGRNQFSKLRQDPYQSLQFYKARQQKGDSTAKVASQRKIKNCQAEIKHRGKGPIQKAKDKLKQSTRAHIRQDRNSSKEDSREDTETRLRVLRAKGREEIKHWPPENTFHSVIGGKYKANSIINVLALDRKFKDLRILFDRRLHETRKLMEKQDCQGIENENTLQDLTESLVQLDRQAELMLTHRMSMMDVTLHKRLFKVGADEK